MRISKTNKAKSIRLILTERQIGILKAALEYYFLDDEFGFVLWGLVPGACFGSDDLRYRTEAGQVEKILDKATGVEQIFSWWADVDRLRVLMKKEIAKTKKEYRGINNISELIDEPEDKNKHKHKHDKRRN